VDNLHTLNFAIRSPLVWTELAMVPHKRFLPIANCSMDFFQYGPCPRFWKSFAKQLATIQNAFKFEQLEIR
jgi:hypothetical protein